LTLLDLYLEPGDTMHKPHNTNTPTKLQTTDENNLTHQKKIPFNTTQKKENQTTKTTQNHRIKKPHKQTKIKQLKVPDKIA